jgi:Velvet factor
MMGNIFANAIHLEDDRGDPGYFFIFPDLSIRVEGRYCLKFDLLKVIIPPTAPGEEQVPGGNQVVAEVYSDVFVVFAAKKFPGMMESTEFTKAIARQGIKINIRGEPRRRGTAAAGTTGGHGRESGRRRKVQVVEVQSDDDEEDEDEESEMSRRSAET